jgi:hypothetical protein
MGGSKAPFAIATALLALALGGPASAAAEGPLDAATVQAVEQQAAALVAPAGQRAAAIVQDTTRNAAPAAGQTVAPASSPKAAAEIAGTPVPAGIVPRAARPATGALAATPSNGHESVSPPHGQEAMPAARSRRGRARAASSVHKPGAATPAAPGPSHDGGPAGAPLGRWKPRNPLLGLGRPVRNATALIELGWLLTLGIGGCLAGRSLTRRLRTG